MIEKSAIIESVQIINDDHGLLSAWLMLKFDGGGQGFGGYALYLPEDFTHHNDPGAKQYAGIFIWRCMEIAGVTEWSKMVGKAIRVRKEDELSKIEAIGHIINRDWFYPEKEFAD